MVKTLGIQAKCPQNIPFAMFFAVEPAFTTISSNILDEELHYNPNLQINDETRFSLIVGGQTSTSVRRSTNTGPFGGDKDDDSKADESQ
ncbi:MAG: hypothetical protein WCD53_17930 [Microcoleus sp.]